MGEICGIAAEPADETYARLVDLAADVCTTFSLVWREQLDFAATAATVAVDLRSGLVREERTDRWPGTILLGHYATVRHYTLTPSSLPVLKRAGRLYAWVAPALPEDVAFYTADGAVWLATISHERDAWFDLAPGAALEVQRRVPGLNLIPRAT